MPLQTTMLCGILATLYPCSVDSTLKSLFAWLDWTQVLYPPHGSLFVGPMRTKLADLGDQAESDTT